MALSTKSGETVKMLRLPPHHKVARWIEYFYEGYVDVIRGEAQVPTERPEWITRMLNVGYAIPKDEPYLETAPQAVVDKNALVWLETFPHLGDYQALYADVAILAQEATDGPDAEDDDSEVGDGPVAVGDTVEPDDGRVEEVLVVSGDADEDDDDGSL